MSEERWRDLFHRAPCGLLSMTPDGMVSSVNETLLGMVGVEHERFVDRYFIDHLTNGSKLFFETRLMPLLRMHGQVREMALELLTAEGSRLPVFVTATLDLADPAAAVHTAVFDASGRQDYERELLDARRKADKSVARVKILEGAARVFSAAMTEAELGQGLAEAAQAATDATHTSVLLASPDGGLELVAGSHPLAHGIDCARDWPEREAIRERKPVVCESPAVLRERFPSTADALAEAKVEAVWVFPLLEDDVVRGALACHFGRERRPGGRMRELLAALCDQASAVLHRIRLQQQIEHQSLHDTLTGLPNRFHLQNRLEQVLAAATRHQRAVAVVFVDLDGFKEINDTAGHFWGDQALRQVSDRLAGIVRAAETLGRFGGDEFLILCEDVDEDAVHQIADRARAEVRRPLQGLDTALTLSASIGVSLYRPRAGETAVTADRLVRLADNAMYEAKRAGKDRTVVVRA